MTDFNPPIANRDTEELMAIAHSSTDIWQQEAIDQAKAELNKRAVSKEEEQKILDKWKEEERLAAIAYEKKLELNKTESYTFIRMIAIFFLAIFLLFTKWSFDLTLKQLWKQNYKRKFYQRIVLLISGIIFWIFFIKFSYERSERLWQKEIDSADISKWERNQNIKTLSVEIPFAGCWVSENYYKSIKKFKSPRKAQVGAEFIVIPTRTLIQTSIVESFHDGGTIMTVLKNMGKYELWQLDEDTITQHLFNIKVISANKLKIGAKSFIKINPVEKDNDYLILEDLLFKGNYTSSDGKKVEFKNNGQVKGLDDFKYYSPIIDYTGEGLGIDQLSLSKNYKDETFFGFKFKNNILEIYDIKCLVYDSINKECEDVRFGKLKYKLTKSINN